MTMPTIPEEYPGARIGLTGSGGILRNRPSFPNSLRVWSERASIFRSGEDHRVIRRLLTLATAHQHESYSVPAAATSIGMSVRQLTRICLQVLGHAPGLIIDLVRIMVVANEIRRNGKSLECIAHEHGYHDAATMSRQFLRITGRRPGAYRLLYVHDGLSGRHRHGMKCH